MGCGSHCFGQKDTKNSNMTHSLTTHEHLTHWKKTNSIDARGGVQETPFEIVSISQASVLLLLLIYGQ